MTLEGARYNPLSISNIYGILTVGGVMSENLTHLNAQGDVHMVDVGAKDASQRMAIAHGSVRFGRRAFECLNDGRVEKGNVLATARVACIMAAKKNIRADSAMPPNFAEQSRNQY